MKLQQEISKVVWQWFKAHWNDPPEAWEGIMEDAQRIRDRYAGNKLCADLIWAYFSELEKHIKDK